MDLKQIGSIDIQPETKFHWDTDSATTVEHTPLPNNLSLIRVSKSYRLLKQDSETQKNWDSKIRELNDYLETTFDFQITLDYINEASPDVTGIQKQVQKEKQTAEELLAEKQRLENQLPNLSSLVDRDLGSNTFQDSIQGQKARTRQRIDNIDAQLDRCLDRLRKLKQETQEWRRNGVMQAYIFTTSTTPEVTDRDWKDVVEDHIQKIQRYHANQIEQTLAGPNSKFKLVIEEVEEPRVFNRRQYARLLNPDAFHQLIEENPGIENTLRQLRRTCADQFQAYSLQDLEVDDQVVERSKATPAQAVNGLLQSLESENVATVSSAPNSGPYIGTLAGTRQTVGFDPARIPHWYFAGKTDAGKSYLSRVILENAASLGYNIIGVTPTDREALGAAFPSPLQDSGKGRGLAADYYWPGNDRLLDWPDSVSQLLNGRHMVSMHGLDESRREELLTELFEAVYQATYGNGNDLFLFVDEAQRLGKDSKQQFKKIVKEKRSHNVHGVVITQNPKEFKRHYSDLRTETTTICLHGEYGNWAKDIEYLDSHTEIQSLEPAQAIFHYMDMPKFTVDIRTPVSQVQELSESQLTELDSRYQKKDLAVPGPSESIVQVDGQQILANELTHKQEELMDWIQGWLGKHSEHDYITASKCHRPEGAPCNARNAKDELEVLAEQGLLETSESVRGGKETTVYRPIS
jgi:hypothetical protein